MPESTVQRPLQRPPLHPGEVLRDDVLPALGLSVSAAARRLGVSRQQLHRMVACTHPITTEMALRLGRLAGNEPGLWLRMQQTYKEVGCKAATGLKPHAEFQLCISTQLCYFLIHA